jgi:multidrug efflux pump subunit AcrB
VPIAERLLCPSPKSVFVDRYLHDVGSLTVVLGLASLRTLGVDIYPKVDFPTVTVTTRLEGASPEEIESQITKRIEEAVNTIVGSMSYVRRLSKDSRRSLSPSC